MKKRKRSVIAVNTEQFVPYCSCVQQTLSTCYVQITRVFSKHTIDFLSQVCLRQHSAKIFPYSSGKKEDPKYSTTT